MKRIPFFLLALVALCFSASASLMTNVYGRDYRLLNGRWDAIVDLYDQGDRMKVYENRSPEGRTDFYEYSFDGGLRLEVPGDWNSQNPELKYYEGTVWYGRHFESMPQPGKRQILYFGAVSYRCNVYLNGRKIASHEGGFTPFEVDVTDALTDGDNFLVVEANNRRTKDAIPALAFDWWNYGGITRDVMLVSVPDNYVEDYFVRLRKGSPDVIDIDVRMSRPEAGVEISVEIPALRKSFKSVTDAAGRVSGSIQVKNLKRWAPEAPVLYDVIVRGGADKVSEEIGFRNIEVAGTKILINGKPQFMRCISFHEEIPQRMGRAFSKADATMLLNEASELGVNMIRLAHYPQNEYTVRMAEKMGIVLWQEIPIWQGIDFADSSTRSKAQAMLREMISRDKNRCAVGFWGVANETKPSAERNDFLKSLLDAGKEIDTTRLYVAAFDLVGFDEDRRLFTMDDPFTENLDVVAVNKYMGWYHPWPLSPAESVWEVTPDKPLIISEFGGEALYGQSGSRDVVSSWSEDYQARLYEDNLRMMENIPNLAGVSPWILFDFRSPFRFHPLNQEGWNRKGLVSDRGQRKKAWYIMRDFYRKKRAGQ
ncbi:MAG: glycoside hydrolase family 2 [Duncaniella sp.]|uniref:glycoside hydrolase family 2 protein n=1 Tax=Duncaniella sp. TaxID=2518496 RepID=UPI0023BBAD28|nr:glycoside hydrolase family 2 TIM barrel-domain containing protein [Duncaniella sp.]MDE5987826.1 glycoside hydrolase family 2 [Duncaniella sp.]